MLRAILILLCSIDANTGFHALLHVIDGRTGKPVRNKHVVIISGQSLADLNEHKRIIEANTDARGEAAVTLYSGDLFRIWVDWSVPCDKKLPLYTADTIAREGEVSANTCGSVRATTQAPGNLYIYVRPENFGNASGSEAYAVQA